MGDYLDKNKPMGKNVKRLLAIKVSRDAIPAGGGFAAGLDFVLNPERMIQVSRQSLAWIEQALAVFKTAPDNPYGDDDEAIAGAILSSLEAKYPDKD
jgi:hypothetical protein